MTDERTIHLVTSFGSHFTPFQDILLVRPYPSSEEYSRRRIGIAAASYVLAKGPFSGGATVEKFQHLIEQLDFVKLPQDELALNPNIRYSLDAFDPLKDADNERNRFSAYLVIDGAGLALGGEKDVRVGIQTPTQIVLDLFPNISSATRRPQRGPSESAKPIGPR